MSSFDSGSYDDVPLTKKAILEEARTFDLEIVTKLSCTSRRLTRIACLENCVNITELNLSKNSIRGIEGLENLVKLKKLTLTSNRIESLENIEQVPSLQHLLIQDNRIANVEDFQQLQSLPNLQSVYFQNHGGDLPNPICSDRHYKIKVLNLLPNLRNLDGERKPSKNLFNIDVTVLEPEKAEGDLESVERKEYVFQSMEDTNVAEMMKPAKALLAELQTLNISAKEELAKAKASLL